MARKISAKQGKDFFDTRSSRVLADLNFAQRSSANPKTEIGFIREAFPLRSKDDITLVLQSCDYNVEAAIACFTNGEADNLLKEWNIQGRKSKSSKKKRNKKKQAKNGEPETLEVAVIPQNNENVLQLNENNKDAPVTSEEDAKKPLPAVTLSLECPSPSPGPHLLYPPTPSPSSSELSLPSSNSDQQLTDAIQDPELASKRSPRQNNHAHAKFERMTSTGPDALKKTVKDLQRSSVSLPRFQLLLEEECDKSFKYITKTFQELRQCLNNRETHLLAQMEEFKKQAVEMLEQRQENAAALKLKSDRVGGMPEGEVTQLRSEIKNFVTERKIDEELARTTRFIGDKDQLLSTIANFGGVVPIKSCYSPVTLNPPPLPTKKAEGSSVDKKVAETVSSPKALTSPAPAIVSVPIITAPTDENSVSSHKALQEVAELHAKLQAALQQQGLSSSTGKPVEGQKQSKPDHKKDTRPNSASQAPRQQQTSRRPQTAPPQNQQQSKDGKQQREKTRQNRSAEPRVAPQQDKQNSNQSYRNSRRSNQRRPPQRNAKSDISNEKNESSKNEATHSSPNSEEAQEQVKVDKEKQSQDNPEKVMSQQPKTVKENTQSGNRNRQPREQREGGDERPRNRNRRRGGRRGAYEGHNAANEKDRLNVPGEKSENGSLKNGPAEKGPLKEEMGHDINTGKDPVEKTAERNNGATAPQEGPVVNGKENDVGSSPAECQNGANSHVPVNDGGVKKEALPRRPDRPSRRRGAQREKKDGPSSGPAPNRHLNGTKPVENGTEECHSKEESKAQSNAQTSTESTQNETESKREKNTTQELEKDLDKAIPPRVNGYIPVKEIKEVSIDR